MANLNRIIEGCVGVGLTTSGIGSYMLIRKNEDLCARTNIQVAGVAVGVAGLLITSRSIIQ